MRNDGGQQLHIVTVTFQRIGAGVGVPFIPDLLKSGLAFGLSGHEFGVAAEALDRLRRFRNAFPAAVRRVRIAENIDVAAAPAVQPGNHPFDVAVSEITQFSFFPFHEPPAALIPPGIQPGLFEKVQVGFHVAGGAAAEVEARSEPERFRAPPRDSRQQQRCRGKF